MSARTSSLLARRPSQQAGAPDVDVTPVMNMFIILVPFLVSMAVFTQVASHAFSLPASDGAGEAITAAELPLTVVLRDDGVLVARGDRELAHLPADLTGLDVVLAAERRRGGKDQVVVAVDDAVTCAAIVRCLDRCRDAGFTDVGIAEGGAR
jgi:biopolymer transport protein ExbD